MKNTTEEEGTLVGTIAHEFIKKLEDTSMSKSYKMPLLLAFLNLGKLKFKLDEEDIYQSFKSFYEKGSNGFDLTEQKATKEFKTWGKKQYVGLSKRNPENFLLQSAGEFF